MKKILIVDDEPSIRELLSVMLTDRGYTISAASDGMEGFELFKSFNPDIAITDVRMPRMDGLTLTKQMKQLRDDIDVIVMTGFGTEELVIEALRAGASNYLKKPIDFKDLLRILENTLFKRKHRERLDIKRDVVTREEKTIVIGNTISDVWGVVNQIILNIHSETPHGILEGLRAGLYEIIINAIEHGNLGITYEQKTEALARSAYLEIIEEKARAAEEAGKKVTIHSKYDKERLSVEIRDDGAGFNIHDLPDVLHPEMIMSAHGRGILLTNLYFDKVLYREPGNTVLLEKNLGG